MQLDRTLIAIRQRNVLETLDLSLHVVRVYSLRLLATMAMGVAPLMIVNHLLLGWMLETVDNELDFPFRFVWHMIVLVALEAPLASIFATSYLGQAVFLDRPSLWQNVVDVARMLPRIAWCQLLVRGIAPAWLLLLSLERYGDFQFFQEGFLLAVLMLYAFLLRAFRPFVNEIVILERNPLTSPGRQVMTVGRRSAMLHGAAGGELVLRWFAAAVLGVLLTLAIYGMFLFFSGVLLNDWSQGRLMVQFFLPLSMWATAGYLAVFRFLSYLDVRIRQEGWEVELRLRAEAARLTRSPT